MTILPGMVWDACTILNLVATDRAAEILAAMGGQSYIEKQVRLGEVFSLRPLPEIDPKGNLVTVDLSPLIADRLLIEVEMTPDEQATFIRLAAEVDDGEARSTALAIHRGLTLVTDDKKCIRLIHGLVPAVAVLTTLDWVKLWTDARNVDAATIGDVLRRIEVCAHYRPRRNHPLKAWWESHL